MDRFKEDFQLLSRELSSWKSFGYSTEYQFSSAPKEALIIAKRLNYASMLKARISKELSMLAERKRLESIAESCLMELEKLKWPSVPVSADTQLDQFSEHFERLLKESNNDYAFCFSSGICEPLRIRFRFHFMSDQATNRMDKPEWFFSHVLKLAKTHLILLQRVQKLLTGKVYAIDEFLYSFFDLLEQKIVSIVHELQHTKSKANSPAVSPNEPHKCLADPSLILLAHLFQECINFDKSLGQLFAFHYQLHFDSTQASQGYFTTLIVSKYSDLFFRSNKHIVEYKLQNTILKDKDALQSLSKGVIKSSLALLDLVESICEIYRGFLSTFEPSLRLKLKFLKLQSELLETFLEYFSSQRPQPSDLIQTFTESIRLLSAFVHITRVLEKWNTYPFFIDFFNYMPSTSKTGVFDDSIELYQFATNERIGFTVKLSLEILKKDLQLYKARPRVSKIDSVIADDVTPELIPLLNKLNLIFMLSSEEFSERLFDQFFVAFMKQFSIKMTTVIEARMYSKADGQKLSMDFQDYVLPLINKYSPFKANTDEECPQLFKGVWDCARVVFDSFDKTTVEKSLSSSSNKYFKDLGINLDIEAIRKFYNLRLQ